MVFVLILTEFEHLAVVKGGAMEKGKIGSRLEDITLKIEEEYSRFTEHFLFITKYVLTACFERLYTLFKLDPEKSLTVEKFLEKPMTNKWETYKPLRNQSRVYFSRINGIYREYREFHKSDVEFRIKKDQYNLPWCDELGEMFRLRVIYNGI
jgi:hypothetical protein